MNIGETIRRSIESRDYNETIKNIEWACEEVFGYRKIAEHCLEEELANAKDEVPPIVKDFMNDGMPSVPQVSFDEISPGITLVTVTGSRRTVKTGTVADKCFHYGNSSEKEPEGIIAKMLFERVNGNYKLGIEDPDNLPPMIRALNLPPVSISGYGERQWDQGESGPVPNCYVDNLQIPPSIQIVNEIPFEDFINAVSSSKKS